MIDKTIRRPESNKEHIADMSIIELAKLLQGFCDNSKRCYFCPFYKIECAGIDVSVDEWVDWLEKPFEKNH